jgi:hypothetical protein
MAFVKHHNMVHEKRIIGSGLKYPMVVQKYYKQGNGVMDIIKNKPLIGQHKADIIGSIGNSIVNKNWSSILPIITPMLLSLVGSTIKNKILKEPNLNKKQKEKLISNMKDLSINSKSGEGLKSKSKLKHTQGSGIKRDKTYNKLLNNKTNELIKSYKKGKGLSIL